MSAPSPQSSIGAARSDERRQAIAAMDDAFIGGRGRASSLARRYPELFADGSTARLLVARQRDAIASALVLRPFRLLVDGQAHDAAMIGLVCTPPALRGQGFASTLLCHAVDEARALGAGFCVLWTQLQAFYARLGWRAGDAGVLGALTGSRGGGRAAGTDVRAADPAEIDGLARARGEPRVARSPGWYATIPVSAEQVAFRAAGTNASGHAIVGQAGRERYVYELAGDETAVHALLDSTLCDADRVLLNSVAGSRLHAMLAADARIRWQPQTLAMWMPLAPRYEDVAERGWVIPYFDRI